MSYTTRVEKFLVEASVLGIPDSNSLDVSRYVTDINVRKDYSQSSFPLVVVNFMITEQYRDLIQNNEVSIRLRVSKFTDIDGESQEGDSSVVVDDVVFDTIVRSYSKPFSSTMSRKEEDSEAGGNQSDTIQMIPYQVVGIPEELIQKNASVVNEVYEDAKMDEILVNILSSVEKGGIFIDPSDNVDRQRSLVIPPMNVVPAIKYLQEVYGIYDAGLSLFFDFDGTYLTKLFARQREYSNTLEVLSVPANDNDADSRYTSNQIDDDGNVRLLMNVPPPFVSSEKINEDYVGQTAVFNSYDFNFNPVRRVYEQGTDNRKTRYFWNQYQNRITELSYVNETLRTSQAVMVILKNASPSYFRQDTLYKVTSDRPYVSGEYNILEQSFSIFTRGDYRIYESVISLKLSKKN
jgi:hypothetical protein